MNKKITVEKIRIQKNTVTVGALNIKSDQPFHTQETKWNTKRDHKERCARIDFGVIKFLINSLFLRHLGSDHAKHHNDKKQQKIIGVTGKK